jgi:hypothetical protein
MARDSGPEVERICRHGSSSCSSKYRTSHADNRLVSSSGTEANDMKHQLIWPLRADEISSRRWLVTFVTCTAYVLPFWLQSCGPYRQPHLQPSSQLLGIPHASSYSSQWQRSRLLVRAKTIVKIFACWRNVTTVFT